MTPPNYHEDFSQDITVSLRYESPEVEQLPFPPLPPGAGFVSRMPATPPDTSPVSRIPTALLHADPVVRTNNIEVPPQLTPLSAPPPPVEEHAEKEENANERLLVFSDGIIAFALTVAAITIKIPATVEQLEANSSSIVLRSFMYIVAFIIVANAWVDHHTVFHYIKRNTTAFVVLNFFYLSAIVMFPIGLFFLEFGTELTAVSDTVSTEQILLGLGIFLGSQIIAGLALCAMWIHAKQKNRLLAEGLDPRLISYMTRRLLSKPTLFIFLTIMAFLALYIPVVALPVIVIALVAREIYFHRIRRKLDLTVGTGDTKRIQLFSDAVIGIAITLSVAQIEFPSLGEDSKNALEAVNNQWPLLHAFLVGIVIMGAYWLFHYHLFHQVKRHDSWLVFLNCFFLLAIALMLIPVNWLVNYYHVPGMGAYLFFGLYQMMTSLILVVMWRHVTHKRRLLADNVTAQRSRQYGIVVVAQPLIFLALTIFAGFVPGIGPSIYIALYFVLLGIVWFFAQGGVQEIGKHFHVRVEGKAH